MKKLFFCAIALVFAIAATAQHTIQSPYKNLDVKIKGCNEHNGEVVIDLVITSIDEDRRIFVEPVYSKAFDDEGEQYGQNKIYFKSTGGNSGGGYYNFPADVPVKFQITIKDVNKKASVMALVDIGFMHGTYGTMTPNPLKIKNIDISR